jgi:DNA-binding CsgD family transcriptional regulator
MDAIITLTDRECEVIGYLVRGDTNIEVAAAMGVGLGTAKVYLVALFRKLKQGKRTKVMKWASDHPELWGPAAGAGGSVKGNGIEMDESGDTVRSWRAGTKDLRG